jgi:hypothetical protein
VSRCLYAARINQCVPGSSARQNPPAGLQPKQSASSKGFTCTPRPGYGGELTTNHLRSVLAPHLLPSNRIRCSLWLLLRTMRAIEFEEVLTLWSFLADGQTEQSTHLLLLPLVL